jgi:hypothetical protein
MTQTQTYDRHPGPVGLDGKDVDGKIPWVETDPRRAPVRNDVINALEAALCPAVLWIAYFSAYYEMRPAAIAATIVALAAFVVTFVVSWARMTTARRLRATVRTPRTRTRAALFMALGVGIAATFTGRQGFSGEIFQIALGLAAAAFAALTFLVLERFAIGVPAAPRRAQPEYWPYPWTTEGANDRYDPE